LFLGKKIFLQVSACTTIARTKSHAHFQDSKPKASRKKEVGKKRIKVDI
jgi:hypothetical protein